MKRSPDEGLSDEALINRYGRCLICGAPRHTVLDETPGGTRFYIACTADESHATSPPIVPPESPPVSEVREKAEALLAWRKATDDATPNIVEIATAVLVMEEALRQIAEQQPETLAMIRNNGFVFDDIGHEPGNWQHLAFSIYCDVCRVDTLARGALVQAATLRLSE